jgi:succinyl-CoA synthetase beta subunit
LAVTGVIPLALPGDGPWMVKAQVPVGGRGEAGGVVRCTSRAAVDAALGRLLGARLKGHAVEACLVEQAAEGAEHYLSVMVDAASYGFRVIYAGQGGVDIERSGAAQSRLCPPHPGAVADALADILGPTAAPEREALLGVARKLADLVVERELALAEINPLFVSASGCVAGDAKIIVDLNVVERQPRLSALIHARPAIYADAVRKLTEGFDYVELDPEGEIGLVTTGAGLSMMLIDELTARGARPLNFCDIRTGQMRGSPARLMRVLDWITARPSLKAVLVNIFAGITDLSEFATLLATAIEGTPALTVPVVARLVGRHAEEAKRILGERQPAMLVTEDLEEALRRIDAIVAAVRPAIAGETGVAAFPGVQSGSRNVTAALDAGSAARPGLSGGAGQGAER